MKIVEQLPHEVQEIEHLWIPMADGCRLAARLWLPCDAERQPVPAIVEYIPYRKRDGTRPRDEPMHRYFAGHGYAVLRIDLRGSGESDGILLDEYLSQEQQDGCEALRWIAAQPWCSGAVGMMGKSWGGFNSLQVAARRPPELRAIITVCSTDDRYADDAHYMGGCLLNENLTWGSVLFTLNAQPPDPELLGARWREVWRERLEHDHPFPEIWLRHQRRDDYWRHGSVCEDFDAIACPVYAIGGWADGYSNAVPRLLAGLRVPRKGLVGPWAHVYPHEGVPGPAIGFLQEALRWWDHWLREQDRGLMDEPAYRAWMQESVQPRSFLEERPGRWVAEPAWPSDRIRPRRFALEPGRLREPDASDEPVATDESDVPGDDEAGLGETLSPQTVGLSAGGWCGFGVEGELPTDQREDDAHSLVFDSEPLPERLEMLGAPVADLSLRVDRPSGFVVARLNDVAPDGSSRRVSYGLLNLTHRGGHARPEPLEPGRRYAVRVQLNDAAHAFPAGHRLRLALSTSYWPLVWPSPAPVRLTLLGGSRFALPVRPPRAEDAALRAFEKPEMAPPADEHDLDPTGVRRSVERDTGTGETIYRVSTDLTAEHEPALSRLEAIDLERGHGIEERFVIRDDDPLSARAEIVHKATSRRADWSTRVETATRLRASADAFQLEAELRAWDGDELFFEREWKFSIPRDGV